MKLQDCEQLYRCLRGHNVAVLYGDRALTPEEGAALAAEYLSAYGPRQAPAYVSPAGWQLLDGGAVRGPLAARFEFDEAQDIVCLDGRHQIAGGLFDTLTEASPDGKWFRIISADEVITVETKSEQEIAAAIAPAPAAAAPIAADAAAPAAAKPVKRK